MDLKLALICGSFLRPAAAEAKSGGHGFTDMMDVEAGVDHRTSPETSGCGGEERRVSFHGGQAGLVLHGCMRGCEAVQVGAEGHPLLPPEAPSLLLPQPDCAEGLQNVDQVLDVILKCSCTQQCKNRSGKLHGHMIMQCQDITSVNVQSRKGLQWSRMFKCRPGWNVKQLVMPVTLPVGLVQRTQYCRFLRHVPRKNIFAYRRSILSPVS